MRRAAIASLTLAALAACVAPPPRQVTPGGRGVFPGTAQAPVVSASSRAGGPPTIEATASGEERAYASAVLAQLQLRSFAENREFCGYLGLSREGEWMTTPIIAGNEASCGLPNVPAGMRVAASFHTHGTYSPFYASEWPTSQDVTTDAAWGIDGYISTPGGRLWHVDTDTLTVRELCGRGCLPQDPAYVAAEDGPLRPVLSLAQLRAWERGLAF